MDRSRTVDGNSVSMITFGVDEYDSARTQVSREKMAATGTVSPTTDHALTVCAISLLSGGCSPMSCTKVWDTARWRSAVRCIDDGSLVKRIRFEACRCGWDTSESGGYFVLDRIAEREESLSSLR
jgi:hypothetical protein